MLSSATATSVLAIPRTLKRLVVVLLDTSLCLFSVWIAFYLRLGELVPIVGSVAWAALVAICLAIPIFVISGTYRAIFRYSGGPALISMMKAMGLYGIVYAAIFTAIGFQGVPRTVGLIQPILLAIMVGASRAFARFWLGGLYRQQLFVARLPRALIFGAGSSGRQLANSMARSTELRVVGFLDDDSRLHRQILNGLRIYAPDELPLLVHSLGISTILLAIPSANQRQRNDIISRVLLAKVSIRTLPTRREGLHGGATSADLQDLDVDDLLGRIPVEPDPVLFKKNIYKQVVLVSGAAGSIGSELCRQVLAASPKLLLIVDQSEEGLYRVHEELIAKFPITQKIIIPLLASVLDENRIRMIMTAWQPHVVFHAAAYKHVPIVEHNITQGFKNNVYGTQIMCEAAIACGVSNFVLISTDKAVRPTNIMGASKRLAELVLQALSENGSKTVCSIVRFGNVLGSSGSVVPKFRSQIKMGGPITVTHPEVTRYFMTIPEAAQLVIQSSALAEGGDVFVLDMGRSVEIIGLARRMIELSGRTVRDQQNPDGDIAIEITGLRPGEKLFEELLIGNNPQHTSHLRIMRAQEPHIEWQNLQLILAELLGLIDKNDVKAILEKIAQLDLGYVEQNAIVDWIYLAQQHQEDTISL
jgi:FlaA1/EpsC-like NDP-sugar epimerase